ncbi:major capsid protein [Ornithinibacillus sp. 4-3]|uniref:Major capsid protein n=1 Tax=Ornithinibacillus sp. 4-3 TaxID=3231488 RepID=A0AB39HPX7_9BACI
MKNQQIMKDTITTGSMTSGLLNPEQSKRFIRQTFENTALGGLIRTEMRRAKTGEIDKIGIDSRILRAKTENTDDGYRAKVKPSAVEYATTAVRLPWEITEETLRENIEGESYEETIETLMTTQLGLDLEDLYINGDVDTPEDDEDYNFLKLNDGWLKQLKTGSHVEDRTDKNAGALSLDVWYDALKQMPNKFNNGTLRWLVAPSLLQDWEKYLLDLSIKNGGGLSDSMMKAPASIPALPVPSVPHGKIILTNPKNLIVVNSYSVKIRKTTEGKEAIMKDKRFYVTHLDFDPIIEEKDAAVLIEGIQ